MAEPETLEEIPEARVDTRRQGLPIVWLLPLVAALLGAWLVFETLSQEGPLVTIRFENAEGIEPKKTRVKYRDVDVGMVEEVRFSDDLAQVEISVRLDKVFDDRITESTRFWVVRPRIEGMRISGLETLISGAYITMDLGHGGDRKRDFEGLEEPRSILSDTPGTFYRLHAPQLGSLTEGSPVYFRQIAVGELVKYALAEDHSHVRMDIFIRAPHDSQVRARTRFWNVSGVELDLSAKGLKVGVQSLAALVAGGIAFETPQDLDAGAQAAAGTAFPLYTGREQAEEHAVGGGQPYVLYFEDTVRGLAVGAPVEFRGIRVGTVTDIAFEGSVDDSRARIPVRIELEPERVPLAATSKLLEFELEGRPKRLERVRALIERLVRNGLRARLQTGNLLTGQLFVELDLVKDAAPAEVIDDGPYLELPTVPSTFRGITLSLTRVLAKLERMPLEEIGQELKETLVRLKSVAATLDQQAGPLLEGLTETGENTRELMVEARQAVRQADDTLKAMEGVVSEDGAIGRELVRTLEELSAAARSIRIMAEYLERHPEALLQGKKLN